MTQTTTTAPITTIPAAGLVHTAGDVEIRAMYVNGAGYKIMARRDGDLIASQLHTFETEALAAIGNLIAEHTPARAESTPVRLAPAAKGTATKVSDPQHTALAVAAFCGSVQRGGHEGQASVKTLTAMARRGYLQLTYQTGRRDARKVVTGGTITGPGRTRLAELTAADRELAAYTARLQAALTFDQPTNTAPVAA
jgi:hypothetical protein